MRSSPRLLATATAGNALRPSPMALLPPIPLYRRILRAHRKRLPAQMRLLGDQYVKAEFRAHRNVDNPTHMILVLLWLTPGAPAPKIGFLTEWQLYAQKIEGDSWIGEKLDPAKVAKMNDQQIVRAIRKGEEGGDGERQ
ncbi:hypothetical protein DL766_001995 [Monosporascus sp. MC13-8B]|uniref:Succinate dehydrogenase assembly factor 3 n=1 Tax=Monosporascus cannonballus TaxID=155416 RepID=A0ABY0HH63_9PEZI|nr:hypothetical protein DL762_002320 [Monosporascus cannonballus]RYO94952.1 hypothetical protein DL763_003848 [Monosporascus cannonballus]RYP36333.1 hypothetical protein DL766_001995 [Monosporascus sp. MC13-8B]